jgi:hypothetical protein
LTAPTTHNTTREFWRGKLSSKSSRASLRALSASAGSASRAGGSSDAAQPPGQPHSGAQGQPQPRRPPAVVNFKDLNLSVDDELSEDPHGSSEAGCVAPARRALRTAGGGGAEMDGRGACACVWLLWCAARAPAHRQQPQRVRARCG